ncbi:MAG: glycosyltransferase family 2 protein [Pseudonocardia sp.]
MGARESDALAVVAVTHSPGEALDRLLDSVKAATQRPVRVLVADLGSTDGAPERAAQRDGVALLRLGEVLAQAAAINRAVAELGADVGWIAVAEPGVEWGEGALDALLAAAQRFPRAGLLGPALRLPDGAVRPSVGELPAVADVLRGRLPVAAARREGPVGWVAASCVLLRRAAWESVDGFDARHPAPFDAIDYADRLDRAGWLRIAVPSAVVSVPAGPAPVTGDGGSYLAARLRGPRRAAAGLALRARRRLRNEEGT